MTQPKQKRQLQSLTNVSFISRQIIKEAGNHALQS